MAAHFRFSAPPGKWKKKREKGSRKERREVCIARNVSILPDAAF